LEFRVARNEKSWRDTERNSAHFALKKFGVADCIGSFPRASPGRIHRGNRWGHDQVIAILQLLRNCAEQFADENHRCVESPMMMETSTAIAFGRPWKSAAPKTGGGRHGTLEGGPQHALRFHRNQVVRDPYRNGGGFSFTVWDQPRNRCALNMHVSSLCLFSERHDKCLRSTRIQSQICSPSGGRLINCIVG